MLSLATTTYTDARKSNLAVCTHISKDGVVVFQGQRLNAKQETPRVEPPLA